MFSIRPKTRRFNLLIICLLGLSVLLTACGDQDTDPAQTSPLAALPPTVTPVPAPAIGGLSRPELGRSTVTTRLVGSGSTFAASVYRDWFPLFKKDSPNITIEYQAIGSGSGRNAFLGTPVAALNNIPLPLDFAGSDAPFRTEQLERASQKGDITHIPTTLGAVVAVYNLREVPNLRLSGPTLARIYMGSIIQWNDPAIELDNPELKGKLPNRQITVVIRARNTGSGTSEIFSRYLSVADGEFRDRVGPSDRPAWDKAEKWRSVKAQEADSNEAVATAVRNTDGAIGYVDQGAADEAKLTYAAIRNKTGRYIKPEPDNLQSVSAAAAGAFIPDDFRTFLVDAEGTNTYPIVGFTWLIVWRDLAKMPNPSPDKAKAMTSFLWWAIHDGQRSLPKGFAPLPESLVPRLERLFVPEPGQERPETKVFIYDGKVLLS